MKIRRADKRSERRLEELREQAWREGRVDARGVRPAGAPFPKATPENGYYGLPLLKPPTWTWEVPGYFFVGGAAGAASVIAAVASARDPELSRDARRLAAFGGALSPVLLISDLGRPERFLNMLRVFKPQSPMSVGAWTLVFYSSAAVAAALAELAEEHRVAPRLARVLRPPASLAAAASGLVLATYTGVLVGATAIPAWSESASLLPIHFGASGLACASAILELAGHRSCALNRLGVAAAAAETAIGTVMEASGKRALDPLKKGSSGVLIRAGGLLSGPLPLALRLFFPRSARSRRLAAISSVVGSLLTRVGWVAAGRASAKDPRVPLGLTDEEK
jgi:polysulfide reductase-like protein